MASVSVVKPKPVEGYEKAPGSNMTLNRNQAKKSINEINPPMAKRHDAAKIRETAQTKIEHIAKAMENYVRSSQRKLTIQVHNATGDIMVKVISEEDGKVIREIPPHELLNLAAKMEEMMGTLFNENA